ncbi:lipopolysaccharide biosynthesis protein [uncultured Muribaculum sp.]|uniref:lipopolysaccharide biosynthesis protein n=1 Tax=uncultured Muribaculum sp. TaxID=1918613 RepID=UPI0025EB99BA|nr:lipopolysaccharide biosynthesis protein [uncultured Muribaculum sp.]
MGDNLGKRAIKGTIWASVDRIGSMGLQFVVNLVLARLLTPADFGAIGMIMIFILVSQVFVDGGFSSALIQRKDSDQTDFSTIFFWNIGVGMLFYLTVFLGAPFVARFYEMPVLEPVLRVLGVTLIFNAAISVQTTRLQKSLSFGSLAAIDIASSLAGGALAVVMAMRGMGVWSLVGMMLSMSVIKVVMFYCVTRWLPSAVFSKASLRRLFAFGGYLFCANLLQTACQNVQGIIIGKRFSASQMGYYSQADKLNSISGYTLPQIIVQVMYPVYSRLQDDRPKLVATMLMNFRVIAFVIFPLLSMLVLVAEPLIVWLYGELWLPSVPYFRILCAGSVFMCLTNINYYAVAAVGRSRQLFLWSFYKWGMLLALLLVGMWGGMTALMWAMVASHANIFLVNALLSRKWVGLRLRELVRAVAPIALLSLALLGALTGLQETGLRVHWALQALAFMASYVGLAYALRFRAVKETIDTLRRLKSR